MGRKYVFTAKDLYCVSYYVRVALRGIRLSLEE